MKISSQFDSGNIVVKAAENPLDIQLEIQKDHQSDFFQWFHFRLETQQDQLHKINIINLSLIKNNKPTRQGEVTHSKNSKISRDCP